MEMELINLELNVDINGIYSNRFDKFDVELELTSCLVCVRARTCCNINKT